MRKFYFTMMLSLICTLNYAVGQNKNQYETAKIKTSAVCDMCKNTIEKDLSFERGIKSSNLDLDTQIITIIYDPQRTNIEKIKKTITYIGYDADELPADEKAYHNLNACCKKEKGKH